MKIIKIISKISKCVCVFLLIILFSIVLVSYKISKEKVNNPYCICNYEEETIILDYNEIINYQYMFECSTLYFTMEVIPSLNKHEILSLLLTIANEIKHYECFTHFEVNSQTLEKTLYVSIDLNDLSISYVGG